MQFKSANSLGKRYYQVGLLSNLPFCF